ncbi:MAG: hypothetical protein ABI867_39990 [Kofleriaceae bacterium]
MKPVAAPLADGILVQLDGKGIVGLTPAQMIAPAALTKAFPWGELGVETREACVDGKNVPHDVITLSISDGTILEIGPGAAGPDWIRAEHRVGSRGGVAVGDHYKDLATLGKLACSFRWVSDEETGATCTFGGLDYHFDGALRSLPGGEDPMAGAKLTRWLKTHNLEITSIEWGSPSEACDTPL